jgi:hypothetical protein
MSTSTSHSNFKKTSKSSYNNLTIEELKETLEMYKKLEKKSSEEEKFIEADIAYKKINEIQQILDKKNIKETQSRHLYEKTALEMNQQNEISNFFIEKDKNYYQLKNKYEDEKRKLEENQNEEIEKLRELYINKNENKLINPSLEISNLQKQIQICVKNKEYIKANEFKFELNNKIKTESEKVNKYKMDKFNKEMEKLNIKHINERKMLENRYNQIFLSFQKNNSNNLEKVQIKYRNKIRQLENKQKNELLKLKNIAEENEKGIKINKNYKFKPIETSPPKKISYNNNLNNEINKSFEKDKIHIKDNNNNKILSAKKKIDQKNIKNQNNLNKGPKRNVFK